jgi:TRAP-type transport system periplasmic protein
MRASCATRIFSLKRGKTAGTQDRAGRPLSACATCLPLSLVKALGDELPMQLVAGGQLYGARAALPSLSRGIADAGPVVTTYYASELKHVNILSNLMMLADDPLIMLGATVDTIFNDCPQCLEDFRNQRTVYLAGYAAGGYSLLCNRQVTTLAEVTGKRVRTTGPLGRLANAMKATPVSMTVSDFVEALRRGMVDCVMGPVAFFQAYPIADSVTHIYDYGRGCSTASHCSCLTGSHGTDCRAVSENFC